MAAQRIVVSLCAGEHAVPPYTSRQRQPAAKRAFGRCGGDGGHVLLRLTLERLLDAHGLQRAPALYEQRRASTSADDDLQLARRV